MPQNCSARDFLPRFLRHSYLLILFAVLAQLSAFNPQLCAAIFTSSITINEGDTIYDGQDIIVSNATVTINGPHNFNSVLLTNNAVLNQ